MMIIVTGASGFVGRAVCKRLLAEGWQVRGTVRSVGQAAGLPAGVEPVPIPEIGPETEWSAALAGVDLVVHLAARVHVMRETRADSLEAFRRVNVVGTTRLAEIAGIAGVKRFVFISSVKVNGEGSLVPYTERDAPAPKDPYGISKLETEQSLRSISKVSGMEAVVLRPPLVYGPGVKANFLEMMSIVKQGMPLPLASIDNQRSFVYLENLVDAITTCMVHPKAVNQTYLVSDGEDVSTPQLIRCVAAALGRPARLFHCAPALLRLSGKIMGKSNAIDRLLGSLIIDMSKIRTELGWSPPYTMEQGLRETAEWFKKQY